MTDKLEDSLRLTIDWLLQTRHKLGGSSAAFRLYAGWNKPYPETTGYIIPTLINYHQRSGDRECLDVAYNFGEWLVNIQDRQGYWLGGVYPSTKGPSVFNTGQILFGIIALYQLDQDEKWLKSAVKAATWLAENVGDKGLWNTGHYGNFNPTYYTRVAWPMLLVATSLEESFIKKQAINVLDRLIKRRTEGGGIEGWGFVDSKPAFTHTIAYTIRGFVESSLLLNDWERYGEKVEAIMDKFYHLAELKNGRLAGKYNTTLEPASGSYSCLTGNAQIALCLLRWHQHKGDLRLINAASKLVNYVSDCQYKSTIIPMLKGAIGGSQPIWGQYMRFRYPNWAAKFHADALMLLTELLNKEREICRIKAL